MLGDSSSRGAVAPESSEKRYDALALCSSEFGESAGSSCGSDWVVRIRYFYGFAADAVQGTYCGIMRLGRMSM